MDPNARVPLNVVCQSINNFISKTTNQDTKQVIEELATDLLTKVSPHVQGANMAELSRMCGIGSQAVRGGQTPQDQARAEQAKRTQAQEKELQEAHYPTKKSAA